MSEEKTKRIDKNKIAFYMLVRNALINKGMDVMDANIKAHDMMKKIKKGLVYENCLRIYNESLAVAKKEAERGLDHK